MYIEAQYTFPSHRQAPGFGYPAPTQVLLPPSHSLPIRMCENIASPIPHNLYHNQREDYIFHKTIPFIHF